MYNRMNSRSRRPSPGPSFNFSLKPAAQPRNELSSIYYPVSNVWYKDFENEKDSQCEPLWVDPKGNNTYISLEEWKSALVPNGLSETLHCDMLRFHISNQQSCSQFLCLQVAMVTHDTQMQMIPNFSEKFHVQSNEILGYVMFQLKKKFKIDKERKVRLWKRDQTETSNQGCVLISNVENSVASELLAVAGQKVHSNFGYPPSEPSLSDSQNGQYNIRILYDTFCKDIFGGNSPQSVLQKTHWTLILEVSDINGIWPTMVYEDVCPIPRAMLDITNMYAKAGSGHHQSYGWQEKLDEALVSFKQELKESTERMVDKQFKKLCTDIKGTVVTREEEIMTEKDTAVRQIANYEQLEKEVNEKKVNLDSEEKKIQKEKQNVMEERKSLEEDRRKFNEMKTMMENVQKFQGSKVTLNVGGQSFETSLLTLKKSEKSMLGAMFSGRHEIMPDEDGSYFIDRDGSHFRFILNYLRDGGIAEGVLPNDRNFLNQLLQEATYYNISGLVGYIESKLDTAVPL